VTTDPRRRLAPLVAALACSAELPAAEQTFRIDPERTSVEFELGATLHTVHGAFRVAHGEIRFDPQGGAASGRVVVDATSGDTGRPRRDRAMHGKVLESATHPEIVFEPQALQGELDASGSGRVELRGTLEVRGERHEVSLPAEVTRDGERLDVACTFVVPYVEWGLHDPSTFVLRVEKQVTVTIRARGRLETPPGGADG
jgi:polyisoprenoid-binding protein YceI